MKDIRLDCAKCGSESIEMRYFILKDSGHERLSCHCTRCQFRWNQPVLEEGEIDDGNSNSDSADN